MYVVNMFENHYVYHRSPIYICIYMCTYECIMLIIIEMSHLTRIVSSPDDEFDYENSNLNMGDLDPDCNLLATSNTALTTKYYLESDINEIMKCNDNYARGLSLMHLNIRSIQQNIDKLSNYLTLLDLQFSIIAFK